MTIEARKMPQASRSHSPSHGDRSTDDGWSSGINTPSSTPSERDEAPTKERTDAGIHAKTDHPSTGTRPVSSRQQQAQTHAPDLGLGPVGGTGFLIMMLSLVLASLYAGKYILGPISFSNPTATVTMTHTRTVTETRFQKFASLTVTSMVTETHLGLPTKLDPPDFWYSALASLVPTATATTTETMTIPTITTVEKPIIVTLEKHVTTTALPPLRDRVYCDSKNGECVRCDELRSCLPVTVAHWPLGERTHCYGNTKDCFRYDANNPKDCEWRIEAMASVDAPKGKD
jgi:hypothetical protein